MAITNLTGTKWYFNETITLTGTTITAAINYFASNNQTFRKIIINTTNIVGLQTDAPADYMTTTLYDPDMDGGDWYDQAYRTITITGGVAVENQDLINFLTANATLIPTFKETKTALKIYEDLTQAEYEGLEKEPNSFYLVNNVGVYKGEKLISTNVDISNKQDTLVSGTNIKTINNQSILGSGNITIEGGGGGGGNDTLELTLNFADVGASIGESGFMDLLKFVQIQEFSSTYALALFLASGQAGYERSVFTLNGNILPQDIKTQLINHNFLEIKLYNEEEGMTASLGKLPTRCKIISSPWISNDVITFGFNMSYTHNDSGFFYLVIANVEIAFINGDLVCSSALTKHQISTQ